MHTKLMNLSIKKIFILFTLVLLPLYFYAQQDTLTSNSAENEVVHKKKGFFSSLFKKKDKENVGAENEDTTSVKKKKCKLFNRKKNKTDSASNDTSSSKKKSTKLKKPKKEFEKLSYEEVRALGADERVEYYKKKIKYDSQVRAYKNNKIRKRYGRKEKRLIKRYALSDADKRILNKGKGRRLTVLEQIQFNKATKKATNMSKELRTLRKKKTDAIRKCTKKLALKNRKEFDKRLEKEKKEREKQKKKEEKKKEKKGDNENSNSEENTNSEK